MRNYKLAKYRRRILKRVVVAMMCIMLLLFSSCDKEDNIVEYADTRIPAPAYLNAPNDRNNLDPTPYMSQFWMIEGVSDFPENYRNCNDEFQRKTINGIPPQFDSLYIPTRIGLETLGISGSGEFSPSNFEELINKIRQSHKGEIIVVDLRAETHGFINEHPVFLYSERNWCNLGKSVKEICEYEKDTLANTIGDSLFVYQSAKDSSLWQVNIAIPEEDVCRMEGVSYKRIPALDYGFPSDDIIEEFVNFVNCLPRDVWLHFHCKAGKGRTTLFMAFYDMIRNPKVSCKDIVYRQYLIGGQYLFNDGSNDTKEWRKDFLLEKSSLVPVFYDYVQANWQNNYQVSFSEWKKYTYK